MPDHPESTRYQRIFEQAPEAHLVLCRKGGIVAANQAACELLGYTCAELTGGVHITELDLQATQDDVDQVHSDPEQQLPTHFESRYRRRDGREFPAEVHINAIRTDGEIEVFTMVRDITRERQSEQALKSLETQLGATIRHAPLILFALDAEGCFTLSDGAGLQTLGLKPGEVLGRDAREVYADQPAVIDAVERTLRGDTSTTRSVFVTPIYASHGCR